MTFSSLTREASPPFKTFIEVTAVKGYWYVVTSGLEKQKGRLPAGNGANSHQWAAQAESSQCKCLAEEKRQGPMLFGHVKSNSLLCCMLKESEGVCGSGCSNLDLQCLLKVNMLKVLSVRWQNLQDVGSSGWSSVYLEYDFEEVALLHSVFSVVAICILTRYTKE